MSRTCILLRLCRTSARARLHRRSTTSSRRQQTPTRKQPFMLPPQVQLHTMPGSCAAWSQRIWLPRRARPHGIARSRTIRMPCPRVGLPKVPLARRLRATQASHPMRLRRTTLRSRREHTQARWYKCRHLRQSAGLECRTEMGLCTNSSPTVWLGTRTTSSHSLHRPICQCTLRYHSR